MRRGVFLIIIIISVLDSGADEKKSSNRYLSLLVENYKASKKHCFQAISWDDSLKWADSLKFTWGEERVVMSFNTQEKTNIDIFDDDTGLLLDTFILDYGIAPYFISDILQTEFRGYKTLVISHYLMGATSWTAKLHIMHLIIKTDFGFHYQELSSFFSSTDSFADLNFDGTTEFICVRLILDVDGDVIVPVIFSFSEAGLFRKSTSKFKWNPARFDRSEGLTPMSWEDVSESVKNATEFSEPKAYYRKARDCSLRLCHTLKGDCSLNCVTP